MKKDLHSDYKLINFIGFKDMFEKGLFLFAIYLLIAVMWYQHYKIKTTVDNIESILMSHLHLMDIENDIKQQIEGSNVVD